MVAHMVGSTYITADTIKGEKYQVHERRTGNDRLLGNTRRFDAPIIRYERQSPGIKKQWCQF